jgi:hypothetical protein
MNTIPEAFWSRIGWVILGVTIGVFLILWLRVLYYEWAQLRPNMAPQIAYFLAPGLIVVLVMITGFFEAGFSKYWFVVPGRMNNVLLGVSYASIVVALVAPLAALIFIITNPLVVRWIIRRRQRNEQAAV